MQTTDVDNVEYAGFWIRVGAALIDTLLLIAITFPLLLWIYGWSYFGDDTSFVAGPADFVISWLAPAVAAIAFWLYRQATPGKMALSLRVVDATTGSTLSIGQSIGRYLAYYVSAIPLFIGFIWVAFDSKKRGWHDKLAGTVVIRAKPSAAEAVRFEPRS
ncbi:MAG: RDD family protein [Pseudomonadota bacterium]|nr:RDD family protein [Pseudomonadota bacterium]